MIPLNKTAAISSMPVHYETNRSRLTSRRMTICTLFILEEKQIPNTLTSMTEFVSQKCSRTLLNANRVGSVQIFCSNHYECYLKTKEFLSNIYSKNKL